MAQKLYEETNIQAIANALRGKLGNTTRETATVQALTVKTSGATGHDSIGTLAEKYEKTLPISFTNAQKVVVVISCKNMGSLNLLYFAPGNCTGSFPYDGEDTVHISEDTTKQIITFENTNTITLHVSIYANTTKETGFYAQIVGYDADGNSIQETFTTETEVEQEVPNTFKPSEMAAAVDSISGGSSTETVLTTKTITANGTYNASLDDNADGYSSVTVNVPETTPNLQNKEVTITTNGTQNIAADDGYDGLSGTSITVNVTPNLQDKNISVTENSVQSISFDEGYDGLNKITLSVNVQSSSGGSSMLDNYAVVFENNQTLSARNSSLDINTKRITGSDYQRAWYASSDVSVGDNIMEHITYKSITSTSKVYMGYFYHTTNTDTPTLTNMKTSTSYNGDYTFYKYTSVSLQNNKDMGNLIICSGDGMVLFNGTWANGISALNDKTINLSKGIFFLTTDCVGASSGVINTINLNA